MHGVRPSRASMQREELRDGNCVQHQDVRGHHQPHASVVAAGTVDDSVLESAVDAVETVTPLRYSKERLVADLSAPDLEIRMRGDLILLAEQLQPQGIDALLVQTRRIAALGGASEAQLAVIARAERYLGAQGFRPTSWRGLFRRA